MLAFSKEVKTAVEIKSAHFDDYIKCRSHTTHQVVVSVTPSRNDKIKIRDLYLNPQLMNETPGDELTRIYYVACSRAKEDLYIHIQDVSLAPVIQTSIDNYIAKTGKTIAYEFIE